MTNNGAMYGGSRASGNSYEKGSGSGKSQSKNQHQYQHQHRYQKGKGSGHAQVERKQYSDFQGWLNQSPQTRTQDNSRYQTQIMSQDSL